MDLSNILLQIVLVMVPMLLCLTVHEYAHALTARWLGDDTATRQGRLTLNPMAHLDPFGSVLLPLLMVISQSGFFFGWAKPVPVNPVRFNRRFKMKTAMLLTAVAGPVSNLLFAALLGIVMWLLVQLEVASESTFALISVTISINVVLALFNMIPVPPLDGSKVLIGLLPDRFEEPFRWVEQRPWILLMAFMAIVYFAGPLLREPVRWLVELFLPS